jgi:hypothetical protein
LSFNPNQARKRSLCGQVILDEGQVVKALIISF